MSLWRPWERPPSRRAERRERMRWYAPCKAAERRRKRVFPFGFGSDVPLRGS
jgi:hypothetical protein